MKIKTTFTVLLLITHFIVDISYGSALITVSFSAFSFSSCVARLNAINLSKVASRDESEKKHSLLSQRLVVP